MKLEDHGPDWNRQYPRYAWTPPRWVQVLIVAAWFALIVALHSL